MKRHESGSKCAESTAAKEIKTCLKGQLMEEKGEFIWFGSID
jgi:hypothetical protein